MIFLDHFFKLQILQKVPDRLGTHFGEKTGGPVLILGPLVFFLRQKLLLLQGGFLRVDHDVFLIIEDLLKGPDTQVK